MPWSVVLHDERVVVVHILAKQTAKTPRRAIRLALQRAEDVS
jgi:phage-related protein